jgi:hypothetical protein
MLIWYGYELSPGNIGGSVVSLNNCYIGCSPTGGSPAPGYIPIVDGSGNIFHGAGSVYNDRAVNIMSVGDMGTEDTNGVGNSKPLFNVQTLSYLALGDTNTPVNGMPTTGSIRLPSASTLMFRNNAASGDITGLMKETSDVVHLGAASVQSTVTSGTMATLTSGVFLIPNGSTITNFTGGYLGQKIAVESVGSSIIVYDVTKIITTSGINDSLTAGMTRQYCQFATGVWTQI